MWCGPNCGDSWVPIESLMGVFMCGLSAGYFFVVVSHIHQSRHVKTTSVSTAENTTMNTMLSQSARSVG